MGSYLPASSEQRYRTIWPNMNPADSGSLQKELHAQASALQRHDQQLNSIVEGLQAMAAHHECRMEAIRKHLQRFSVTYQSSLTAPPPSSPACSSSASEARVPPLERCSGAPDSCCPFLVQCSLAFKLQPSAFPTERSRVAYIISLLTGKARDWGTGKWERNLPVCSSVNSFSTEFRKSIKDEAVRDLPTDLAIRIDGSLRERRRERVQFTVSPALLHSPPGLWRSLPPADQYAPSGSSEPMQLGPADSP